MALEALDLGTESRITKKYQDHQEIFLKYKATELLGRDFTTCCMNSLSLNFSGELQIWISVDTAFY